MNSQTVSGFAVRPAMIGIVVQVLFSGLLLGGVFFQTPSSAWYLFWTALAGVGVWTQVGLSLWPADRAGHPTPRNIDDQHDNTAGGRLARLLRRFRYVPKICRRFAPMLLDVAVCAAYGYGAYAWFPSRGSLPEPISDPLALVALYALAAFGATLATIYYLRISGSTGFRFLLVPARHLGLLALLFCVPLAEVLAHHVGLSRVRLFLQPVIPVCNGLLAAERLAVLLLRPLQPRRRDDPAPEVFRSYLLEVLANPAGIGVTTRNMLGGLLGYDVSATSVFHFGRRLAVPLIVLSAALMTALSAVVIIGPGKHGVITLFGRISGPTMGPGLYIKAPWPLGGAKVVDTDRVRRIHVGSHRPETPGSAVFKEGVPLLWTNMHGLRVEEFLIVASPKRLIRSAAESGGKLNPLLERAPSISLAGADVMVEYVISDLHAFLTAYRDPERLLHILAEAHVSSHILRYEIDDLFSDQRVRMAQELRAKIQASCDDISLGIDILHVGATAVHPPLEVADTFEENVSARQDRETIIQQARQNAIREQVETAGTITNFERLIALIENEEGLTAGNRAETEKTMLESGGLVSRILAEAVGYRWSREDSEGGKAERFIEESNLFRTSPGPYRYDRYLSVLESTLADKRKILLTGTHRDAVLELGSGSDWRIDDLYVPQTPADQRAKP